MKIYRQIEKEDVFDLIKRNAAEVALKLFPKSKMTMHATGDDPLFQLIELDQRLIEFGLFSHMMSIERYEFLLQRAFFLEKKRKEMQPSRPYEGIGLCVLAKTFEDSLVSRITKELSFVSLYEFSVIESFQDQDVLIRPLVRASWDVSDAFAQGLDSNEKSVLRPDRQPNQELSTPELIAFARLGMEIRNH